MIFFVLALGWAGPTQTAVGPSLLTQAKQRQTGAIEALSQHRKQRLTAREALAGELNAAYQSLANAREKLNQAAQKERTLTEKLASVEVTAAQSERRARRLLRSVEIGTQVELHEEQSLQDFQKNRSGRLV